MKKFWGFLNDWGKKTNASITSVNEIVQITLEYKEKHIDFDFNESTIRYRNVISPRDGGLNYPQGFFAEKSFVLDRSMQCQCKEKIEKIIYSIPFRTELDILPPGASGDAYMYIETKNGQYYYRNVHASLNGSYVETEPVSEAFTILFRYFEQFCVFTEMNFQEIKLELPQMAQQRSGEPILDGNIIRISGFKCSATGVFFHAFYRKQQEIGSVSGIVSPKNPVNISGFGQQWSSEHEDCTIVPGMTRYVYESGTNHIVFKLRYNGKGEYDIFFEKSEQYINVYADIEEICFFQNKRKIAIIKKVSNMDGWRPDMPEYNVEPILDVVSVEEVEPKVLLAILSFTMLRFDF